MDGLKRFEYPSCGRVFFWKRREKSLRSFQTKKDTCGRARVSNANDFENIKNYAGVSTFEINWKVPFKYQLETENM